MRKKKLQSKDKGADYGLNTVLYSDYSSRLGVCQVHEP